MLWSLSLTEYVVAIGFGVLILAVSYLLLSRGHPLWDAARSRWNARSDMWPISLAECIVIYLAIGLFIVVFDWWLDRETEE